MLFFIVSLVLTVPIAAPPQLDRSMAGAAPHFQRRSTGKKPSSEDLMTVESNCFKDNLNSVALSLPLPAYPREALRKRIGGTVTIKVFVDESGKVYHAAGLDGLPLLQKAVLRPARHARFAPFTQDGKRIKCSGLLVYKFKPPDQ